MSIFDTVKAFVTAIFDTGGELDDYSGDTKGTDLDDSDWGTVSGDGSFGGDFFDEYFGGLDDLEYLEDLHSERLTISTGEEALAGELVTTLYDAQSVSEYVSPTPINILKIFAEVTEKGVWEYKIYRFPSE